MSLNITHEVTVIFDQGTMSFGTELGFNGHSQSDDYDIALMMFFEEKLLRVFPESVAISITELETE